MGQQVHCAFCSASGDESFFRMYHGSWACLRCIGNKEQEAKKASSGGGSSRGGSSGGGSIGGSVGGLVAGYFADTLRQSNEAAAELRAQEAVRKARADEIGNFVFDTENEQAFVQQVISMCEDYKGLKAGALADKVLKAAYANRIKKEFAILAATKPELLAKVKGFWEEAETAMKKKNKVRHIIAIALPVASLLIGLIIGIVTNANGIALALGGMFAFLAAAFIPIIEGLSSKS